MQNSTIITINSTGIVQSVDKNCCRLFGYELEELIGHSVKLIIPPPYKEQHDTYLSTYMTTKVPRIIGKSRIVEGQSKDGSIFPIRLSVSKIGEGDALIFIGMIDKLEDKSASITINTAGLIVSCNQNVEDLFGYKANELIGHPVSMLMPTPHKEKHNQYMQNYLAGGPAKVIGRIRNVPARHKNGTVFPISMQVEQLKVGAIQLFRGKLEKVDLMEAVFTLDDTGKVLSCNQNFVQTLFGYANQEIVGKNIDTLIPSFQEANDSGDAFDQNGNNNSEDGGPDNRKKRKTDGGGSVDEVPAVPYSWKNPGVHKKEALHKDGSFFPVILEIYPFQDGTDVPTHFSVRVKRAEMDKDSVSSNKLIGKYYVVKTVGQGSYGKVKLAIHKETKNQVAIKILQKSRMKPPELERTMRETDILRKLQHPNIAALLDVIETDEHMNIVMEFAGRTLLSYVLEKSGLGEAEARKFFLQILSAIQYCHDRAIIHRDIKHQNILLDEKNNCKIIDFGLSNFMEEGKLRSTFCGTPAYAAPEMILGKKYVGPEVDIWSMGVVLYSMITGVFPFENVGDIIKGAYKDPKDTSPACCDLLKKMLQVEVEQRATLEQICAHPWVANEISPGRVAVPSPITSSSTTNVALANSPVAAIPSPVKEIEVKVLDGVNNNQVQQQQQVNNEEIVGKTNNSNVV